MATNRARHQVAADVPEDVRDEITRLQQAGASFRELVLALVEAWRRWPDREAGGTAFALAVRELRWSDGSEERKEPRAEPIAPDAAAAVRAEERERVMEWAADRLRSEYQNGILVGSVAAALVFRGMDTFDLEQFTGRWIEVNERRLLSLIAKDQRRYADSLAGFTGKVGGDPSIGSAYVADLMARRRAVQWAGVG